ncbi:MAG: oligosaccharide flippase family protein, partial [Acetobacteraceae bacterium]
GCAAAWRGAGAWAVVAQQAAGSAAGAAVLVAGGGWWPRPCRPRWGLLRVGLPLTLSTLVLHGRYRVFLMLLGASAGAPVLGEVHMAFRLVEAVRELASTALWRLMLPAFSARQADPAALRAAMRQAQRGSVPALLGLCVALGLVVRPVAALLLGPAWAGAGQAALPLVGLAAWQFVGFAPGAAVVARGVPWVSLRANLASLALLAGAVALLRPAGAMAAVWVWVAAQAAVAPWVVRASGRVLGVSGWQVLRGAAPGMGWAALAAAAGGMVPAPGWWGVAGRVAMVGAVMALGAAGRWGRRAAPVSP